MCVVFTKRRNCMAHAIIFLVLGICGWLLPKSAKTKMVNKEAQEWLNEKEVKNEKI